MAGSIPVFEHGPITYEVEEPIAGGALVEARDSGKIGLAAADSTRVLGVATKDAVPANTQQNLKSTVFTGRPDVVNLSPTGDHVAVARNAFHRLNYLDDVKFGQPVVSGGDGTVKAAATGVTCDKYVGYCADPKGASTGSTAITYIGK